jgi:hypothetical protein
MKQRWFMHSMFNISLPIAEAIFTWANVILVVGAVLALMGTAGVFWSGGVRERYADERIAANEAETARAKAEAAQARLEQERLKAQMAWRRVTQQQASRLAAALNGKGVQLWLTYVGDDPESALFREDLNQALTAAGVTTKYFSGYARAVGLILKGGSPQQRALVVQAFREAGLPLVETNEPGFMKTEMEVLVGSKPPPEFGH